MATLRNYYAGANSSGGFYSLYDEALRDLDHIYILKGGPGTGKSTFMRKIGLALMEQGLDLEYYHCSSDNQSLDGVVVPELKIGFVDGTAPHIVDPKYPGVVEKVLDLGSYRDDSYLQTYRDEIIKITDDISVNFQKAYDTFAEAKKIHLQREDIYLSAMDFKEADRVTNELVEKLFPDVLPEDVNVRLKKVFFGAATPKGAVNFIDNITMDLKKRYIIKGRPGSGKSTLMKKIGKKAEGLGLSVQYFPCGFDPGSLDMIIIPALEACIVDGTAPHIVHPFREGDEVVDMFAECIDASIEEGQSGDQLEELNVAYKSYMTKATNYLSEAKRLHDLLEQYYIKAMDFDGIDELRDTVLSEILSQTEV